MSEDSYFSKDDLKITDEDDFQLKEIIKDSLFLL